jgi:hypothetical protein
MAIEFVTYANGQVGCLYVWGAQGQVMTPALIKKLENSDKNYKRALAAYNDHVKKKLTLIAYDCSGLVVKYLLDNRLIGHDTTANGLYFDQCNPISKSDLQPGDLVFKKYLTKNQMYHVGIYVGGGYVVHAKGRDDGVVREKLSATGWNRFGRLKVFEQKTEGSEGEIMIKAGQKDGKKPGSVYLYQDVCKRAGYDIGTWPDLATGKSTGRDGSMGPHMQDITRKAQRKHGLPQTGEVDALTYGYVVSEIKDADTTREKELEAKVMAMQGAFAVIETTAKKYA